MSSIASSLGSGSTSGTTSTSSKSTTASTDPLASESTFLTLLVSQLQNQDPLNPTDSSQFISQLTGYSQLEQLINIDKNTTTAATTAGTTAAATTSGSTTSSGSTNPTTGTT